MELHIYVKVIHHIYTMFTVYNPLPSYNKLGGCIGDIYGRSPKYATNRGKSESRKYWKILLGTKKLTYLSKMFISELNFIIDKIIFLVSVFDGTVRG